MICFHVNVTRFVFHMILLHNLFFSHAFFFHDFFFHDFFTQLVYFLVSFTQMFFFASDFHTLSCDFYTISLFPRDFLHNLFFTQLFVSVWFLLHVFTRDFCCRYYISHSHKWKTLVWKVCHLYGHFPRVTLWRSKRQFLQSVKSDITLYIIDVRWNKYSYRCCSISRSKTEKLKRWNFTVWKWASTFLVLSGND